MMASSRGSIFVYIFIAIVLFASLSYVIARASKSNTDSGSLERARLNAQSLIEYGGKAKVAVQDMKLNGVDAATLSFLKSGDAGYTTAPHTAKVFHPDGGGLPLTDFHEMLVSSVASPVAGIYMGRNAIDNVGSSADEVILSVRGIKKETCEKVNNYVVGSTTIPSTGASNHDDIFRTGSVDLTAGICASCAGKTIYCVSQTTPTIYTFYAVVDPN
jgi:hypothetical protein